MMDGYQIIATLPDGHEHYFCFGPEGRKILPKLIENLHECMDEDGRFLIAGTKYFWCVPGTTDSLYRMVAYGGYELGGRGCFYEKLEESQSV